MKASELRIGNLIFGVYENDQDEEFKEVVSFLGYDPHEWWYWVDGSGNVERYSTFEPIPLTEEWLLKFGFVAYNYSNKEKGFIIEHKDWSKSIYVRTFAEPNITGFFTVFNRSECHWEEIQFIAKVTTVHQLQNLYFALTGEELEMKSINTQK